MVYTKVWERVKSLGVGMGGMGRGYWIQAAIPTPNACFHCVHHIPLLPTPNAHTPFHPCLQSCPHSMTAPLTTPKAHAPLFTPNARVPFCPGLHKMPVSDAYTLAYIQ